MTKVNFDNFLVKNTDLKRKLTRVAFGHMFNQAAGMFERFQADITGDSLIPTFLGVLPEGVEVAVDFGAFWAGVGRRNNLFLG